MICIINVHGIACRNDKAVQLQEKINEALGKELPKNFWDNNKIYINVVGGEVIDLKRNSEEFFTTLATGYVNSNEEMRKNLDCIRKVLLEKFWYIGTEPLND